MYENSVEKFLNNESRFIQNYAKKEANSFKAFGHRDEENGKVKKRINEFFKKRT